MIWLLLGGAFACGAMLGHFFRIWIVIPASALSILCVTIVAVTFGHAWLIVLAEIAATITCLQVGYMIELCRRVAMGKFGPVVSEARTASNHSLNSLGRRGSAS